MSSSSNSDLVLPLAHMVGFHMFAHLLFKCNDHNQENELDYHTPRMLHDRHTQPIISENSACIVTLELEHIYYYSISNKTDVYFPP